jgi:peptidoglycan/LPS O-acetylase OafA/YrhL
VAAFVPNPITLAPAQWFGNLTLTESWRWHITDGAQSSLLSPSWTLCYEEQFYAIVGVALLLTRRFLFATLAAVTALVLVSMVLLPRFGVSLDGLFLDGKWLMFASGALVYYIVNYARRGTAVWFTLPILLGGIYTASDPRELQGYLTAFVFALLTIGLSGWDQPLAQSRWLRPLRYCGEMCYSLYLVHWPTVTIVSWAFNLLGIRNPFVVLGVGLPLCIGAAVALGRFFHVWIERRFLNANPLRTQPVRVKRAVKVDVVEVKI